MSDRAGVCTGGGGVWGPPLRSSLLLRAGGIIIQGKLSGPREMFRQCLGLLEMLMCSVGHPLTWHMFNEPSLCAKHWPTLEATKKYLGQTVLREPAFHGGESTWNGYSGRVIFELVHEKAEAL